MKRLTTQDLAYIEVQHMRDHLTWDDDVYACTTCHLIDELRLSWLEREDYKFRMAQFATEVGKA